MSQTNFGDEFDDEWDEFTPSQLCENLEYVEKNIAVKRNQPSGDYSKIDSTGVFPFNHSSSAFNIFLDELITNPIKTELKSKQSKIPLGDISNRRKIPPPVKDTKILKELSTPALPRLESSGDVWTEFDSDFLTLIEDSNNNTIMQKETISKSEVNNDIDEKFYVQNNTKKPMNFTVGFSTGKGTPLPPPSKEAKLKTAQLFEDLDDNISSPPPSATLTDKVSPPFMIMGGFTTGNGKKLQPVSNEARKKAQALFDDLEQPDMSGFDNKLSGYTTTSGNTLKPISESARRKAIEILLPKSNFTTASGNLLEPVSESAKRKAMELFDDDTASLKLNFTTASGDSLKQSSEKAIQSAGLLFNESDSSKKRTANGDLKYENVINQYGGFQMGNSKKNFNVSSQAKGKGLFIMKDANEPPKSESPSPSSSFKASTSILNLPKRSTKRVTEVKKQNKQFKSPIIQSNFELTKAAVSNRSVARPRATPVFDLAVPKNRRSMASLGKPLQYTRSQLAARNIPIAVINMTASSARKYVFEGNWGPKQAREDMIKAGTLPNRTSLAWVENHYGLIVWKVASFIRNYPDAHTHDWTWNTILNQLLYRYEREMNMGHRPILKKVLEQDDLSIKHMILMVSDIVEIKQPLHYNTSFKYRLQLTDGWYRVPACIDFRMERAITKRKLKIGSKLSICGAKIIGNLEARSPLEITNTSTMLLITTNSCLPARWDTKLGYHPKRLTIRSIPTIFDDGGIVTALDIVVCRKFPMLYSETLPNGMVITRTAKEEEEARRNALGYDQYESDGRQQVTVNFKADGSNKSRLDRSNGNSMSELKGLDERRVSGYFKIRICDAASKNQQIATLLLSNANELNHIDVVEGNRYRVFFVMPYYPKNKKYPGLDLKTTRMTRWEPKPLNSIKSAYKPRFLSICKDIRHGDTTSDFDLVVLVLQTGTAALKNLNGRKLWHQTLLVTDESQSVCQIEFRLPVSPFSDIKGQVIGLVNLRFEMYDTKFDITCLRATDESEIITKISSSAEYIQKGIQSLKRWVNNNPGKVEQVSHRVQDIQQ